MQNRPIKIHHLNHLTQRHRRRVRAVLITIIGLLILFLASIIFFPTLQYNEEPNFSSTPTTPFASQTEKSSAAKEILVPERLQRITIQHGDSLAIIFQRLHLAPEQLLQIMKLPLVKTASKRLQAGQVLDFVIDNHHKLQSLTLPLSNTKQLIVMQNEHGFVATPQAYQLNVASKLAGATINSSFYTAGIAAHIPRKILVALVNIYGWVIDFNHKIQPGDHFTVLYQLVKNMQTQKTEPGNILAAAFYHAGKTYFAIRYRDHYGRSAYYDADGNSLRKAFRRKPVNIGYISSSFSLHRRQPILGIIRPHTGTDFAAPYGTPIHATGDGRIIFRGRRGGYGRCIVINNGHGITTLYGHMSRFNTKFRTGSHVKMNQVIGYIGSSGLSTGPHVHYEYRINHRYKNPMKIKLPNAAPIPHNERTAFKQYAQQEIKALHQKIKIREIQTSSYSKQAEKNN